MVKPSRMPVPTCKFVTDARFAERHRGDLNRDGFTGCLQQTDVFLSYGAPCVQVEA